MKCSSCSKKKDKDEFYYNDKIHKTCITCRNNVEEWQKNNVEDVKAHKRDWAKRNAKTLNFHSKKYYENNRDRLIKNMAYNKQCRIFRLIEI